MTGRLQPAFWGGLFIDILSALFVLRSLSHLNLVGALKAPE